MHPKLRAIAAFHRLYGELPAFVVRAPGRVNLIGEHTDYNDGFVLPMAIDRAVWIALRPSASLRVRLHALDYDETAEFHLGALTHEGQAWAEYARGVAWALLEQGVALRGWEGTLCGDVPIGAGLSSSAATEMAVARAFSAVSGWEWDPARAARIGQAAENLWVGVNCGIMDQMISAGGREGHALLIDCRTLEAAPVPLPPGTAVVVLDTGTRRGLVGSAYNERRAQCEAAARHFGAPALRDVSAAQLAAACGALDEMTFRRARHVISENRRVLEACDAMRAGDAPAVGRLLLASHASLRDDYEVSSAELDAIVACATEQPGCHGARLTGAGFGGCAVALVEAQAAPAFGRAVERAYTARTGRTPQVYICAAAQGADLES